jgi:dihydrofolate synthase/folylpolyglutamate synthase
VKLGLTGLHQLHNAQLAASAFTVVTRALRAPGGGFPVRALERGLERVKGNTGLRGRCERIVYKGFRLTLDVAHNPDGAQVLAEALLDSGPRKYVVVIGVLRDKDARGIVQALGTIGTHFVCVTPRSKRAMTGRELAALVRELPAPVSVARGVRRGLEVAFQVLSPEPSVLVTGSHYVVGEALTALEKNSIAAAYRLDNNKRKM